MNAVPAGDGIMGWDLAEGALAPLSKKPVTIGSFMDQVSAKRPKKAKPGRGADWACAACTYLNASALAFCEMCGTPRRPKPQKQPVGASGPCQYEAADAAGPPKVELTGGQCGGSGEGPRARSAGAGGANPWLRAPGGATAWGLGMPPAHGLEAKAPGAPEGRGAGGSGAGQTDAAAAGKPTEVQGHADAGTTALRNIIGEPASGAGEAGRVSTHAAQSAKSKSSSRSHPPHHCADLKSHPDPGASAHEDADDDPDSPWVTVHRRPALKAGPTEAGSGSAKGGKRDADPRPKPPSNPPRQTSDHRPEGPTKSGKPNPKSKSSPSTHPLDSRSGCKSDITPSAGHASKKKKERSQEAGRTPADLEEEADVPWATVHWRTAAVQKKPKGACPDAEVFWDADLVANIGPVHESKPQAKAYPHHIGGTGGDPRGMAALGARGGAEGAGGGGGGGRRRGGAGGGGESSARGGAGVEGTGGGAGAGSPGVGCSKEPYPGNAGRGPPPLATYTHQTLVGGAATGGSGAQGRSPPGTDCVPDDPEEDSDIPWVTVHRRTTAKKPKGAGAGAGVTRESDSVPHATPTPERNRDGARLQPCAVGVDPGPGAPPPAYPPLTLGAFMGTGQQKKLQSLEMEWACVACTFLNAGHLRCCEMCGTGRMGKAPVSQPRQHPKDTAPTPTAGGRKRAAHPQQVQPLGRVRATLQKCPPSSRLGPWYNIPCRARLYLVPV